VFAVRIGFSSSGMIGANNMNERLTSRMKTGICASGREGKGSRSRRLPRKDSERKRLYEETEGVG
jgi:hypothetical protein